MGVSCGGVGHGVTGGWGWWRGDILLGQLLLLALSFVDLKVSETVQGPDANRKYDFRCNAVKLQLCLAAARALDR